MILFLFRLQVPAAKASCLEYQTAISQMIHQLAAMTTMMMVAAMLTVLLAALLHELAGTRTVRVCYTLKLVHVCPSHPKHCKSAVTRMHSSHMHKAEADTSVCSICKPNV